MAEDPANNNELLQIYHSAPPEWLPKVHSHADLGYHGFQPPRPGQEEDSLSQSNVKGGITIPSASAETWSAKDMIAGAFRDGFVEELESMFLLIFARRSESIPSVPPSTFKLPARATLNEAKRQTWFTDLANPEIPLYKLGKNIPHGAKGHDLLDLLFTNKVEISRAVWFVRVFGSNETAGLRNKSTYNPTQYSVEWANVVTTYLKKQLMEIGLPSAPRPGINIKMTFKGVFSDPESRERWVGRFSYSLNLLRAFYDEGLVDNRTFLVWLVQQLATCNLAQLGFIARLVDEYLDGMLVTRSITRPFVEMCLGKVSEIAAAQFRPILQNTDSILRTSLKRVCLAFSDAFVSPRIWDTHSNLICEIMSEDGNIPDSALTAEQIRFAKSALHRNIADVKSRCEAMLFRNLPPLDVAKSDWSIMDVKTMNAITPQTSLGSLNILLDSDGEADFASDLFWDRVCVLLDWSVTPLQYGDHRIYAVSSVLRLSKEKLDEQLALKDPTCPRGDALFQMRLFEWLDTSKVVGELENRRMVSLLLGQLIKLQLFSYSQYVQRLIARGDVGLWPQTGHSRHYNLLTWTYVDNATVSMSKERSTLLFGARARETTEDLNERQIRKETRVLLPWVFGGAPSDQDDGLPDLPTSCPTLLSATCHEQFKMLKVWLHPIIRKYIADAEDTPEKDDVLEVYCISLELASLVRCYELVLDLSLLLLKHTTHIDQLVVALDTLRRYRLIWNCMGVVEDIVGALHTSHKRFAANGIHSRPLAEFLLELDGERYLSEVDRQDVIEKSVMLSQRLYPSNEPAVAVPDVLPEILLLAQDTDEKAPEQLANTLWYKYRTSEEWSSKVWDNTVASLRQISTLNFNPAVCRTYARRYADLLSGVDQRLPHGLNDHVLRWFLGPGRAELHTLNRDVWLIFVPTLVNLVVADAVSTTTILQGLVYPAWTAAASAANQEDAETVSTYLSPATSLFELLLLRDQVTSEDPEDILVESLAGLQRIVTRRRRVFSQEHFPSLVAAVPTLVLLEHNYHLLDVIRTRTSILRSRLCQHHDFKQAVYRDLDQVRTVFERPLEMDGPPTYLRESLVVALRLALDDGSPTTPSTPASASQWRPLSSLLTPWKRAATEIELQFALRHLGEDLSRGDTRNAASASLNQLTDQIFSHSFTRDEASFVATIVQCAGAEVAGKFLNDGIKHVVRILGLGAPVLRETGPTNVITRAGDILRLLTLTLEPLRGNNMPPRIDSQIQDEILPRICNRLDEIKVVLLAEKSKELDKISITSKITFLARLLHFVLTIGTAWSPRARDVVQPLTSVLTQLTLHYGHGRWQDFTTYYLLMDTLCYVIDELSSTDPRSINYDPFHNYPDVKLSQIPPDLPLELKRQFRTLLPYVAINAAVRNLFYTSRQPDGTLIHHGPVQNRPWEWTEYLGDDNPDELRNSGSLSLELFDARLTGDHWLDTKGLSERAESSFLALRNDVVFESIFERDWKEGRVPLQAGTPPEYGSRLGGDDDDDEDVASKVPRGQLNSRGASPASSVRSRVSAASFRSPSTSSQFSRRAGSTDVIEADSLPSSSSTRAQKRKALDEVDDGDGEEVQIIDNPDPPVFKKRTVTKGKSTTSKSRTKKR